MRIHAAIFSHSINHAILADSTYPVVDRVRRQHGLYSAMPGAQFGTASIEPGLVALDSEAALATLQEHSDAAEVYGPRWEARPVWYPFATEAEFWAHEASLP